LLKLVLSNCAVDSASLYPIYRKPFDLIFERAKMEEWCALGGDFRTLVASNGVSLRQLWVRASKAAGGIRRAIAAGETKPQPNEYYTHGL